MAARGTALIFEMIMDNLVAVTLAIAFLFLLILKRLRQRVSEESIGEKCVLISGCDSGIGQKAAIHLLQSGYVVFAGCLNVDGDGALVLRNTGRENLYLFNLDVTSMDSVNDALRFVKDQLGSRKLYGLINNAGICVLGEFEMLTMAQCGRTIDVNVNGTIRLTKAFLPLIRQSKGRIVNVTSVNGEVVYPGLSVYCASKFAIEAFSQALRYELKKFGVRVSVVRPGDFARLTNIVQSHESDREEMWNNLDDEQKTTYRCYFNDYHDMVSRNIGVTSYKSFESSSLFNDIKHALNSENPKAIYTSAQWAFRVAFLLHNIMPRCLSELIISTIFYIEYQK